MTKSDCATAHLRGVKVGSHGQGSRGELGLCCSSASLPLGGEGTHCLWASSPPACSDCCSLQALRAVCSQKTLLFPAGCTSALAISGRDGPFLPSFLPPTLLFFNANVALCFFLPSPRSAEASCGHRWPELLGSSCDPRTSQPHSTAAVRLLGGLCSHQHELPGRLQHGCKYWCLSGELLSSALCSPASGAEDSVLPCW